MDRQLLDILVCPVCKGPLRVARNDPERPPGVDLELVCQRDRLAFPVRDDIPVMLVDEARPVECGPA